jgi:gliding motility-associated-like protein
LNSNGDSIGVGDTININSTNYNYGFNEIILNVSSLNCGFLESYTQMMIQLCSNPNIITPNGDGYNDYFVTSLASVNQFVNLSVTNRWGKTVYQTDNYDNKWNGVNNNGDKLKDGTYFYTLSLKDGKKSEQGMIVIINGLE